MDYNELLDFDDMLDLDELLDSEEFKKEMDNLNHVPQMQPQSHASNTLADTGRYPDKYTIN